MTILTQEQLESRKAEARKEEIRQNVKSHCTKIRDGIRNNGTTSGERAIWELFQNARDLSDLSNPVIISAKRYHHSACIGTTAALESVPS